ncbi:hypothetical protein [Bradyrhizobium sp. LB11.1]|uniref:hypothetical protein n=1 Tax=Bradyrhizobium sp. LB11.1 TaxID=3156326 RepID=UPI0033993265
MADGDDVTTCLHTHFTKRSNGRLVQFDIAVSPTGPGARPGPVKYGVLLQISHSALTCALQKRDLRFGRNGLFVRIQMN